MSISEVDRHVKGGPEGEYDANLIGPGLTIAQLAAEVVARLLPLGGEVGDVPKRVAGNGVEWGDDQTAAGGTIGLTLTNPADWSADQQPQPGISTDAMRRDTRPQICPAQFSIQL